MKALQNQILENVKTILEFACENKSLAKSDKNIEEFFEFLYNSILGNEQMLKILTDLTSTNSRIYNQALKQYKLHFQNGPYSFLCDEKCMDIYTNILIAMAQ